MFVLRKTRIKEKCDVTKEAKEREDKEEGTLFKNVQIKKNYLLLLFSLIQDLNFVVKLPIGHWGNVHRHSEHEHLLMYF